MRSRDLFYEYEQYLLGTRDDLPRYHLEGKKNQGGSQDRAIVLALYKYALEYIMGWTVDDIRNFLTISLEKKLSLFELGEKYLNIPPNLSEAERRLYLVSEIYNSRAIYNPDELIISEYEKVLSTSKTWGSNYFSNDNTGRIRAETCLRYCLSKYFSFTGVPEIYVMFNDTPRINKILKTYHLKSVCDKLYASPLEYLHESLSNQEDSCDEFMYSYLKFSKAYTKARSAYLKGKKNGNKQTK